ncbi:YgfZ/GcvT domain-containing protein [Telmatospirillum siberiense]|uniref:Folate-binding protein n=1 Tax=Telmatospirillum siberiense TaxID=382514 RepID=A0A2N3PPA6_9PROT|nr:folate-binding protein YgfZ [Telmatospirillum siberiense]PKU22253.1 folate-binding protein [Telmatospirillum siberiense]
MAKSHFIPLPHRALISLSGEERKTFLQGLVSNDVTKAGADHALYSAFLTPQGKFLHEFFLGEQDETLLLETETERRADFAKRLSLYKLRSKVGIAANDGLRPYAIVGSGAAGLFGLAETAGDARPFAGGLIFVDPRLAEAGLRAWLPPEGEAALREAGLTEGEIDLWDKHRIELGLPDGSRDLVPDKALLLENGFDELHGVDWQKGCYLGQELTARTKYRGLVRKRLLPVDITGPVPEPGSPILLDGTDAGEMRSHAGNVGLAMIRIDAFEQIAATGRALEAGESRLTPHKPAWAVF